MSQLEKLEQRLLSRPKDFTCLEAERLLIAYGYRKDTRGKTSGSAVRYVKKGGPGGFYLHRPHPGNALKRYQIEELIDFLKKEGGLR